MALRRSPEPPGGPARWLPTHVQVTVLQARGLRGKGAGGSSTSDAYTVIQVGREKYSTSVVEKSSGCPEWREECVFELAPGALDGLLRAQDAAPDAPAPGPAEPACELVLTAMHRSLIGIDKFLGRASVALDEVFRQGRAQHTQWYKLHSKAGKKEKERGEIQVTVQFTRNTLSASMFDLSVKDKPRSPFGKIKDKMKGKKTYDLESASAIIPSSAMDDPDLLGSSSKKAKAKTFFLRNKLRKSSLTQSNTSLGSDSTLSSTSGSLAWLGSEFLTRSPSRHSRLSTEGGRDSAPSPKLLTHKRAYSDEVSQVQAGLPGSGHDPTSGSSLCINGSHIYNEQPPAPPAHRASISGPFPSASALHALSLRRAEEGMGPLDTAPWGSSETVAAAAEREDLRKEERKPRMGLFHHHHHGAGRRGSLGEKMGTALGASPHPSSSGEEKSRSSWFGSREGKEHTQKPSLDVSPQVEPGPDAPVPPPPGSLPCSPPAPVPAAAAACMLSTNLFAPAAAATAFASLPAPSPRCLGSTNPFLPSLQSNPFFEELVADKALKYASPARSLPSGSLVAAPTAPSLPEWDDTFNAFAASRLPPDAGHGLSAPAPEMGALGAPWTSDEDVETAESREDPRGGGRGSASTIEVAGSLSLDGWNVTSAGWESSVFQGPSPSSSVKWPLLSQEPEEGETLSQPQKAVQDPAATEAACSSALRRGSSEQERTPSPAASKEPEECGGGGSQFFQELNVITDLWSSEVVSIPPVSKSPPPIPKRSWEQEENIWEVLDEPPGLQEPGPPGLRLDPLGDAGRDVFSSPPAKEEESPASEPGTPPPKPPRLFTPSNSQNEEKEMSGEGTELCAEDIFPGLEALDHQNKMKEDALEELRILPSADSADQHASGGDSVSCWDSVSLVPGPNSPPAVLEVPSPTLTSENTAGQSQCFWSLQETESQFLGTSGTLQDTPELLCPPVTAGLEKDPFWGSDDDDGTLSPSLPPGSPASIVLPASFSAGDEASPESPSLELVAPQDPPFAPPLPPPLPSPCPATNVSRKPGQESLSLHGSRPLSSSTPALGDFPATRGPFEFPSPIEGPSSPQWGVETPSTLLALLPLETRPAEEPSSQPGTSPHPVKPLSSAPPEGAVDKKPPRSSLSSALTSGLEKLKTVTSGGIPPVAPQTDQTAESKMKLKDPSQPDQSAKYYHLTHDELIALLQQRERELSRREEHVHELESYIDQLLVRIMETSPTLLQIPPGPRAPK
ncbi:rab11 family-interacting protein 5 isoform X4 [Notamacropus eugenii]|uniref:rab11 family-interacting protein 5 isoform X4 n=1 Tax=Notamacropus eugenii TaxID=9315 RepID=UPI003B683C00